MPKKAIGHKIKRGRMDRGPYRAAPHPLSVIIGIVLAVALVFVGISAYGPISSFIMGLGERVTPQLPADDTAQPEPEPTPPPQPQPPQPKPEPAAPQPPEELRAVYMPFSAALDSASALEFLRGLPDGINAVMLDVKNNQGRILYRTTNETAINWGAPAEQMIDLASLTKILNEGGYYLIARMQTFSDPICARGDRVRNAIHYGNSEMLWLDNFRDQGGKPWSNPYAQPVRDYLCDIAVELAQSGAAMVVLDGMRFPDDMTGSAFYGRDAARQSRADALKAFVSQAEKALSPLGARTALHIPAIAVGHTFRDARYGGSPLDLAGEVMISILPEDLAEGYLAEGVFVTRPAADPAATVSQTLDYIKTQNENTRIIPLLRALTDEQTQAQLNALAEHLIKEYVLS
ncbi:MAG: putative glycoside hydrolase [Oscillospiraceae bacterium]|nr:putative glycoside hydrolase [Oscillospiraceae bacterium]